MLAVVFFVAIIAPLGAPQSLNAQLHNASVTGDAQQLANLVAELRAANPRNYLSQLSNCYEGPPSACTGDNSPAWCGAYSAFSTSDQDECLSGDSGLSLVLCQLELSFPADHFASKDSSDSAVVYNGRIFTCPWVAFTCPVLLEYHRH